MTRAVPSLRHDLSLLERARITAQLGRAALAWFRHDTGCASPVPDNPLFMSPRQAVGLVHDGDVVAASGLGGNQRASIIYWAIREVFEATGHPAALTVMNLGGHGGRGRAPGTLEELGRPGLCTRLITGHFETFHAMLDLAREGRCELQCIPQGTMALLLDGLGHGRTSLLSATGIGTFIDPRVGSGSPIAGTCSEQLVSVENHRLRYHIPPIDVAIFNAPAADRHGNIYVTDCAITGETREITRAARRNGGRVIANVGCLVEPDPARIFVPADMLDAVVYYPDAEQAAGIFHRDPWRALTPGCDEAIAPALARARFVNWLAGITPRRGAAEEATGRLAATTLLGNVPKGAYVNIGTGMPEEVCRIVFEAGRLDDVTFLVESGPVGGLPAPGVYFGASFSPERIVSSAEMFALCYERLDATCLGALQVDSAGNVNVSRRGEGPRGYVGPGGFIDLSTAARTIVFVSGWMAHGEVRVEGGRVRVAKRGAPKFVAGVDEITFNGARALADGKQVFYCTPVGLFHLTRRGVELAAVMPGIDVQRDIVDAVPMRIVVPSGTVPVIDAAIVTGERFTLPEALRHKRTAQNASSTR